MGTTPAEILESTSTIDEFRDAILGTGGNFPFARIEMERLGEVYFIRYPDSSMERNMDNIRIGYRMVRICVLEKILEGVDPGHRGAFREMLGNVASMETSFAGLERKIGAGGIEECVRVIGENLERVKSEIDSLSRGMIKERFVGGISSFYNNMYLVKQLLNGRRASTKGGE
ncbi:MAG: hypothetical protein E4G96_08295 [Chrysiogenales bacterium]|nr:MAG: hypothetical protein E4G96_08295 [Chrysiogenales bacterium]